MVMMIMMLMMIMIRSNDDINSSNDNDSVKDNNYINNIDNYNNYNDNNDNTFIAASFCLSQSDTCLRSYLFLPSLLLLLPISPLLSNDAKSEFDNIFYYFTISSISISN